MVDESKQREDEQGLSVEELQRLKAENEALKAKLEKTGKRDKRGGFWRRFTVWLLIVLACIFSVLGALSIWVKTTTLDTNTFVNTVAPLVKNKEVAKAVSDRAAQELFKQYDVSGQIKAGLTDLSQTIRQAAPNLPHPDIDLSVIATPIAGGLQSFASTVAQ